MTLPLIYFGPWIEALEQYAFSLGVYVAAIDEIARKSRPASRVLYRAALADADALPAVPPIGPADSGAALARHVFPFLARLDRLRAALDAGAAAALDPAFLKEAVERMSQTFAEEMKAKAAQLQKNGARASEAERAGVSALTEAWGPRLAETTSPEKVSAVYFATPRSSSGTFLYAAVLEGWLRRGEDVGALVERAKDDALGDPPDDPAAVRGALAARAGVHPLQAMEITFGLTPDEQLPDGVRAAVSVDVTLPQAGTAVRYDLAPLIDVRAAVRFGSLASAVSGLNYPLVKRLQTISEETLPPAGPPRRSPSATAAPRGRPDYRPRLLAAEAAPPADLPAESFGAVGAGPRPRVSRLGELLEEAVFGGVRRQGGPANLSRPRQAHQGLQRKGGQPFSRLYPRRAEAGSGREVCRRVRDGPPASADDLLLAITGRRGSRNLYRTYVARAIAEVSKRGSVRQLMRQEEALAGPGPTLFEPRSFAARRQEVLLSQMASLSSAIGTAQHKLLRAFYQIDGPARALTIFRETRGEDLSAAAGRRIRVLGLYRALVDEAFFPKPGRGAKVVDKKQTVESRLSLKLYVLEHGGGGGMARP